MNTSARRTKTYAAAAVQDDDGIKTSFATVAAPVVLTGTDWNGAAIVTVTGLLDLPRTVTISRTSAANQYSVNPIVITGKRGGTTVTESIAQPNDDGNDVLRGTQPFDYVTQIDIPTNAGTGGAYKVGVQDICCPAGGSFVAVRIDTPGTLSVAYDDAGTLVDTMTATAAIEWIAARRIRTTTAGGGTTSALTVYMA